MAIAIILKAMAAYPIVESTDAPVSPTTPFSPVTPVAPVGPVKSGTDMVAFAVALEDEATKVYEPLRLVGIISVELKFPCESVTVMFGNM